MCDTFIKFDHQFSPEEWITMYGIKIFTHSTEWIINPNDKKHSSKFIFELFYRSITQFLSHQKLLIF